MAVCQLLAHSPFPTALCLCCRTSPAPPSSRPEFLQASDSTLKHIATRAKSQSNRSYFLITRALAPLRSLSPGTRTHLGNLILCTLGLSASWNNNLSPAFSVLNSRCLSFLSFVTLASGVYLASNRVTSGVSVEADWNVSGDRDGDKDCLDGDGR